MAKMNPMQYLATAASRPPSNWMRIVLMVVMLVVPIAVGRRRGVAVGVVTAAIYAPIVIAAVVKWDRVPLWSRCHPELDAACLGPLVFVLLAYVTTWHIAICVAIGLVLSLIAATTAHRSSGQYAEIAD